MGILAALQGQRTYLDTNIWIYAIEGYSTYAPALTELFSAIDRNHLQAITSPIS